MNPVFLCVDMNWSTGYPSIHFPNHLLQQAGMLQPIPMSWAVGRKSPWMDGQSITALTQAFTLTPKGNLLSPIDLSCMSLDRGGNQSTHANTGRRCKTHRERMPGSGTQCRRQCYPLSYCQVYDIFQHFRFIIIFNCIIY